MTDRAGAAVPVRVSDAICPVLPAANPELQRAAAKCGDGAITRLITETAAQSVQLAAAAGAEPPAVSPLAALRLTISLECFGPATAASIAAAGGLSAAQDGSFYSNGVSMTASGLTVAQQEQFAAQQRMLYPHLDPNNPASVHAANAAAAAAAAAAASGATGSSGPGQFGGYAGHMQSPSASLSPGRAAEAAAAAAAAAVAAATGGADPAEGSAESGLDRGGAAQDAGPVQSGLEYQAAWELAMWKRAEQARWLAQLQEREAVRMQELEAEWRAQEITREQTFARRQKDVAKLEKKLKEALFDVEKQEKRLRLGEEELARRDANITTEIESAKRDALLTITRLKDQHKHQIGMARMVHDELRRQYEIVKAKLAATQARFTELDEEFRIAKSRWHKSTVRLFKTYLTLSFV